MSPEACIWLLAAIGLLVLATPRVKSFVNLWIALPVREHRSNRIPAQAIWEPTEVEQLTPELRDFLGDTVLQLRSEGFAVRANLRKVKPKGLPTRTTELWVVLLSHAQTGDFAAVTLVRGKHGRSLACRIISHFADGFYIATGNDRATVVMPVDPANHSVALPWINDPATLIEVHRRRVERAGRAKSARMPLIPGGEIEYLNAEWQRDLEWFVRCGYYFREAGTGDLRPTWMGAFFSQWRVKQSIQCRLLARNERRARRLWNELGMAQWQPPASGTSDHATRCDAASAPTDGDTPFGDLDSQLGYQPSLAPGEVRRERSSGTLTVRMGVRTRGQTLLRGWAHIVGAVLTAAILMFSLYRNWSMWKAAWWLPPPYRPSVFHPLMLLWAGILAYEIGQIARALSRSGTGTITVSANHGGLRFSNAPARVRHGSFARSQIGTLLVRVDQLGFGGPVFRLEAHLKDRAEPVVLLTSHSLKLLHTIREELLTAMGMVLATEQADSLPSA